MMEELRRLFSIQSYEGAEFRMQGYILDRLKDMPDVTVDTDFYGNIMVTKGSGIGDYVCVTSHMDTVHNIVSDFDVVVDEEYIYAGNNDTGVGGDDKCGIYACLKLLERCDRLKVVFCSREECGCIGSDSMDISFLDDVGCIIGIDRKNAGDLIQYNYSYGKSVSKAFCKHIKPLNKKYGYAKADGSITDAFTMQSRLFEESGKGVCTMNISCGYYNPHTKKEFVVVKELMNCVNYAEGLVKALDGNTWHVKMHEHNYIKQYYGKKYYGGYTYGGYGYGSYAEEKEDEDAWNKSFGVEDVSAFEEDDDLYTYYDTKYYQMFGDVDIYTINHDGVVIGYRFDTESGTYYKETLEDTFNDSHESLEDLKMSVLGY